MKLHRNTISAQTPVEWAMVSSAFGRCLVARVIESGSICALYLGDNQDALLGELPYKNLSKIKDTTTLEAQLQRAFRGEPSELEVVLDVTDFRFKVLETLTQKVGFGESVTYGQLAEMCGRTDAVRAAASALACNRVALLVPCHRVVPKGGGVGQYRWGADIKSKILEFEKSLKS